MDGPHTFFYIVYFPLHSEIHGIPPQWTAGPKGSELEGLKAHMRTGRHTRPECIQNWTVIKPEGIQQTGRLQAGKHHSGYRTGRLTSQKAQTLEWKGDITLGHLCRDDTTCQLCLTLLCTSKQPANKLSCFVLQSMCTGKCCSCLYCSVSLHLFPTFPLYVG